MILRKTLIQWTNFYPKLNSVINSSEPCLTNTQNEENKPSSDPCPTDTQNKKTKHLNSTEYNKFISKLNSCVTIYALNINKNWNNWLLPRHNYKKIDIIILSKIWDCKHLNKIDTFLTDNSLIIDLPKDSKCGWIDIFITKTLKHKHREDLKLKFNAKELNIYLLK